MFITFEGVDGSGKTTQARLLEAALRDKGYAPLLLREPGGTPISEEIRELLLDAGQEISPLAELLLFSAARAELVERRIRPVLEDGTPVICDRFYDSTTAYQGAGRDVVETEWIKDLNRRATGGLTPTRTYYIDVPIAVAAERRRDGQLPFDRMEASSAQFYERVADAYRRIAEEEPERVVTVDGTGTPEDIHRIVWDDVTARVLSQHGTRST